MVDSMNNRLFSQKNSIPLKLSLTTPRRDSREPFRKSRFYEKNVYHFYEMIALITVLEGKEILTRGEFIEVIKEMMDSK